MPLGRAPAARCTPEPGSATDCSMNTASASVVSPCRRAVASGRVRFASPLCVRAAQSPAAPRPSSRPSGSRSRASLRQHLHGRDPAATGANHYRAPTAEDFLREERALELLREHFHDWQSMAAHALQTVPFCSSDTGSDIIFRSPGS